MVQTSEAKILSRRKFIKASGLSGAALFLGFYFPATAKAGRIITRTDLANVETEMNAWILIDTSGKVTLVDHRAEMGQGSYQSVPQIIAEELEVELKEINIVFAQGNQEKYGNQITGGSSTIRGSYKNLLNLSATAREMLIEAAAKKWNVPASECYAESGHVIHRPSGKKFHYGELVVDASKLEAPKNVQLKGRSEYKLIGKPLHRQDSKLKTNGTATFGLDKKIPGMLYAAVEQFIPAGVAGTLGMLAEASGKFRPVDVDIGTESNGQTEIKRGLDAGQKIVVSGQFLVDSEASLRASTTRMADMPEGKSAAAVEHSGEGKVEAVHKDAVTLSHGPIASMQWGAMTMDFGAPASGVPTSLKPGQAVKFTFTMNKDGVPVLTRIEPTAGKKQ